MKNMYNDRELVILNTIKSLDITPTMFKNANEKYHNIADFLSEHGLEADFYPQGSFALGTVVRPNAKDDNAAYDLDAVCQVTDAKNNLTAKELFNKVRSIFEKSSLYNDKIKVYPKCITIEYSDAGGAKFSIDIIPAVDEEEKIKSEQRLQTNRPDLIGTAIAIPKHSQTNYAWFTNNPRGYKQWFDEINKPYKQYAETTRQKIFETAHMVYDSVEDIPDNLIRTSLQRVIQILKRNRDVYYASLENGDEIKPISAIITTIVAEMAKYANPTYSVFELLQFVFKEFNIYSNYLSLNESEFRNKFSGKRIIEKCNGKWTVLNPALPKDNLADSWNQNPDIPKYFFKWLKTAQEDIIGSLHKTNDAAFRIDLENAFGTDAVQKTLGNRYKPAPPLIYSNNYNVRPWRI